MASYEMHFAPPPLKTYFLKLELELELELLLGLSTCLLFGGT